MKYFLILFLFCGNVHAVGMEDLSGNLQNKLVLDCVKQQGAVINGETYLRGLNNCVKNKALNLSNQTYQQTSSVVQVGAQKTKNVATSYWNSLMNCFHQSSGISSFLECLTN